MPNKTTTLKMLTHTINMMRSHDTMTIANDGPLIALLENARDLLKEQEAVEAEYEGDARSTWWWVCGECHTTIEDKDKFCKECGRRILWGK